jgi:DsbC/DsbD-like thiol-disulfide interchange protein
MSPNRLAAALLVGAAAALATGVARADALYEVTKTEPKLVAGSTATASLTIKAKGGWHMNAEAPITLALTPAAGLSVPKQKLSRADLAATSADSARFDIPVSAAEPGKKSINAEARFVICQESACKPVKETLALALDVGPPTPTAANTPATKKKKAH